MAQKTNSSNLKLFNRERFPLVSFFVFFILCLTLMGIDYRYQISKKIKTVIPIYSPITNLINLPINFYHNLKNNFITKKSLLNKIDNLEITNYNLSIKVQENQLLNSENKNLRKKLKIHKKFKIRGEAAEIILPEVRNGYSIITINKGFNSNIKMGSAVINNRGLVGQVINTSKRYSLIRPITSEAFAVPAILDNGKENVILYGNGNGELEIPLFPASSEIKINDTFITSGADDLYQKGILIGTVSEIKPTKSPKFNYILIEPFSQPTSFSQITVLTIKK